MQLHVMISPRGMGVFRIQEMQGFEVLQTGIIAKEITALSRVRPRFAGLNIGVSGTTLKEKR